MYQWAKNVGEDFTVWANQIYTILQVATDCAALPPSDKSREVIPWASIVGGSVSTGSNWFDYEGVPPIGLGLDGDMCIDTLTGDIYKKVSGSWGSPIMNIMGEQGEQGEGAGTGNTYYGYAVGSSSVTETQIIAPFTIDPDISIPEVGDSILITANLAVSQPSNFPTSNTIMNLSIILRSTHYGEKRVETVCKPELWVKNNKGEFYPIIHHNRVFSSHSNIVNIA